MTRADSHVGRPSHLFRFLMALGCDVDIVIRPSVSDTGGTLRVASPELD